MKAELFACYPLYIPAYLAEFVETTEEKRRCTAITFATSTAQSFAVFPTFKENPTWAPGGNGDSISITVNGVGVGSNFNSGLLKTLIAPILENLNNKARELGVGDPIKNMELLNSSKNLMSYSENHESVPCSLCIQANTDIYAVKMKFISMLLNKS